jgi:cell division septum initiation protein DivIVA
MSIDDILDVLDEMVDKSWGLPGGRCVMDADKIREIIDDIRLNMPQEMRQARAIVADRSEIIKNAKGESEAIIKSAEDKARIIVSQDEVVKQAQAKSNAMIAEAQSKAKDIKKAAADFADSLMKHTEESLFNSLSEVKQARQALKAPVKL